MIIILFEDCLRLFDKMQNVINSVKGTALGVAEFLTPVLKVKHAAALIGG